jgi:hypothetical protein
LLNGICTVELGAGNEPSASLIVPFTDLLLFAFGTVRALRVGYYRGETPAGEKRLWIRYGTRQSSGAMPLPSVSCFIAERMSMLAIATDKPV